MAQLQPQTTAQLFQLNSMPQWWNHPTQRFGQADITGGHEEGTDFSVPYGTKIGSISAGKVVYVGTGGYNDPSLGTVVQIQGSDGSITHYQHLRSSPLKTGQQVSVGSPIGFSGGARGRFSTGPHIEVRYASIYNMNAGVWKQPWIDPYQHILNLTKSKPTATGSGPRGAGASTTKAPTTSQTSTGISGASSSTTKIAALGFATPIQGSSYTLPTVSIGPSDDVTTVLWTIDELLQLIPPWNVINVQQDQLFPGGPTFNDPISWFEGFLFNIGADMIAVLLRLILLVWGMLLGYKVMNEIVDLSAIGNAVAVGAMAAA